MRGAALGYGPMNDAAVQAEMDAADVEGRRYGEVMNVAGLIDVLRRFPDETPVVVYDEGSTPFFFGADVRLARSTRGLEYVLLEPDGNKAIAREEF